MSRTCNETCADVFGEQLSYKKIIIRVFLFLVFVWFLWASGGFEIIASEVPYWEATAWSVASVLIVVFVANLLFIVPYKITSYQYEKGKELKIQNKALKDRLNPSLEVRRIYFEKILIHGDDERHQIYKLSMECINPINKISPVLGIKVLLTDGLDGKVNLRNCQVIFKDQHYNETISLTPGQESLLELVTYVQDKEGNLRPQVYFDRSNQRVTERNWEVKKENRLSFLITSTTSVGQEWELLFGATDKKLWAAAKMTSPPLTVEPLSAEVDLSLPG